MPERDLPLLIDAAQAAGRIAMKHWTKDMQIWDKPGGHGPVSEADLAVDQMLKTKLLAARPDYGWLSEETEDTPVRLSHERVFIIDPIDATRTFIEGGRAFAHSLAIAENGVVIAGVVFLPVMDRLFAASLGAGSSLNGTPLTASAQADGPDTKILATRPNYNAEYWPGGVPSAERVYRPSLAYRMSLVGQGRFDGMVVFRDSWEWDIAAGALITSEAGGRVTDRDGQPLTFNNPTPLLPGVIAAGPPLHADLMARRSPA